MADGTISPIGEIYATTDAPSATSVWHNGLCYAANGNLHISTTPAPTDFYLRGQRFNANGAMVVGVGDVANRPYWGNNGFPARKTDDGLVYQANQTPDPVDPYVHGVRIGLLGGVYMITGVVVLPPQILTEPAILPPVQQGTAVSATSAVVSNGATLTQRRWYVAAVQVATTATYTPVAGDVGKELTYQETWTNSAGSVIGYALPATVGALPVSPPTVTTQPAITPPVGVGLVVAATSATVTNGATLTSRRWLVANVQVATTATYTPVAGDVDKQLTYEETWTNSAGSVIGYAPGVNIAGTAPGTTTLPVINTPVTVGVATTYVPGAASGVPAPIVSARQWFLDAAPISGATGTTYTPVSGDVGKALTIRETWTNNVGSVFATSLPQTVGAASSPPVVVTNPTVNDPVSVGVACTYSPGSASGSPTPTVSAQAWYLDGMAIPGATAPTYTPVLGDYGKALSIKVTWLNASGTAEGTSASKPVANMFPQIEFDFMTGSMDSRLTFTRTSVATYFDAAGIMQTASANILRFDHDPITLTLKGALIENTSTNSFLNSEVPIDQTVNVTGALWTVSFYGTGTIGLTGAHVTTINGTGAYPIRTSLTFTPTAGPLVIDVTGDVQKVQVELGFQASSYILTTGAAATRAFERLYWTGTTFDNTYNSQAGTMQINALTQNTQPSTGNLFGAIGTTAFSADRQLSLDWLNTGVSVAVNDLGTTLTVYTGTVANSALQIIGGYDYGLGVKQGTVNGGTVSSNAKSTQPANTATRLTIGSAPNAAAYVPGWYQIVRYWATMLDDTEMQDWTGGVPPVVTPVGTINYSQAWDQTAGPAAWVVQSTPATSIPVQVVNGEVSINGVPSNTFFNTLMGPGTMLKVDSEITASIARLVSDGVDGLRLRGMIENWWEENSQNWGLWAHPVDWPVVAERADFAEAALVQLDKTVATALAEGIAVFTIDIDWWHHVNDRNDPQMPWGTYRGTGMYWSPDYNARSWSLWLKLLNRVNTVTGTRYYEEPRIIWYSNNEDGISDAYFRNDPKVWGGSTEAYQWFDKIVDGIADDTGDNGMYYAELNARLTAWRDVNAPGWTIPNWGRGGAQGFPKRDTWASWGVQADKNQLIDFISFMEVEWLTERLNNFRSLRSNIVVIMGTFSYQSPLATLGIDQANTMVESHNYFRSGNNIGPSYGTTMSRPSVFDSAWNVARDGQNWQGTTGGLRNGVTAFLAGECGQYSPNRWRYQRMYYEMVLSCLHGYVVAVFNQAQQYSPTQYKTDGRYMVADNVCIASPSDRLVCRAVAPFIRYRFLAQHTDTFVINMRPSDALTYMHNNNYIGIIGGSRYNPDFAFDGTEHAQWGTKKVFLTYDPATPTTTDWSGYSKVTDTQMTNGVYCRNTATEKVWVQWDWGLQVMTPRALGFIDTLTQTPKFAMPMSISNLGVDAYGYVCFLRSDGPWDLFTGSMKLYIHGSDLCDNVVNQGNDGGSYIQGDPSEFGPNNPPGANYFNENDYVQLWNVNAVSQSWGNGTSDKRTTWIRVPPPFTLNLTTPVDLEITGVAHDGTTEVLPSTYSGGVWSFDYDGRFVEFLLDLA